MNDEQRKHFINRIKIGAPDECWEWQAGKNGPGIQQYGIAWIDGKKWKTHRLAYQLFVRPLEAGEWVLHHCDNPPCCNPRHLYAGTRQQNIDDMIKRGRAKREMGSQRYNAILTEEQVERIKREAPHRKYGWGVKIAKEFGICRSAISNIVCGLRWKQIQPK